MAIRELLTPREALKAAGKHPLLCAELGAFALRANRRMEQLVLRQVCVFSMIRAESSTNSIRKGVECSMQFDSPGSGAIVA